MKLTRDKVIALMELLQSKSESLRERKNKIKIKWQERMFADKAYKKVSMLIQRFETQYDNLKMKLYSDFRVYTTGERHRDRRLDCGFAHG